MNHFTNRAGFNAINANQPWRFRAVQPPGDHPFGAYFTTPHMIGRIDVVFMAPPSAPVGEVIADICRQYWPDALFQDVEDDQAHPLEGGWNDVGSSNEFFIYRNATAAEAWEKLGTVAETENTMLHFLIRGRDGAGGGHEVTCVCDARTGEVERIIHTIQSELGQIARS